MNLEFIDQHPDSVVRALTTMRGDFLDASPKKQMSVCLQSDALKVEPKRK